MTNKTKKARNLIEALVYAIKEMYVHTLLPAYILEIQGIFS